MYPLLNAKKRTSKAIPMAACSFCAQDIFRGERAWRCCGLIACEDCFSQLARLELKPFELILGEEEEHDTL